MMLKKINLLKVTTHNKSALLSMNNMESPTKSHNPCPLHVKMKPGIFEMCSELNHVMCLIMDCKKGSQVNIASVLAKKGNHRLRSLYYKARSNACVSS